MPSSRIAVSISITSWFAPPWLRPQSALMPAEIVANRFTIDEPTRRTVRGGAVLLVIGVQDQQQVDRLVDHRIDVIGLARRREHHVQEVGDVGQLVARVQERLADRVLVGVGRHRRHLRQQPVHRDLDAGADCAGRASPGRRRRARPPPRRTRPSGACPSAGSRRSAGSPRAAWCGCGSSRRSP